MVPSRGRFRSALRHRVAGQVDTAALTEGSGRYAGTLPVPPYGGVGTGVRRAAGGWGGGPPIRPPEVWLEPRFTRESAGPAPGPRCLFPH